MARIMKANELRIGNWVEFSGKYEKIAVEDINRIHYNTIQGYKPIPITEEILLKCGFEKYGNDDDGFRFYKDDYFIEYMCFKTDETSLCNLKYLHQLQNLYFALTGKELEIKL